MRLPRGAKAREWRSRVSPTDYPELESKEGWPVPKPSCAATPSGSITADPCGRLVFPGLQCLGHESELATEGARKGRQLGIPEIQRHIGHPGARPLEQLTGVTEPRITPPGLHR